MLSNAFATDVRQTLDQFRQSVDQMFDSFYTPAQSSYAPQSELPARTDRTVFSPAVESAWTGDQLLLRAILPGVAQSDMHVHIQNNQLMIEGERKAPEGFTRNAFTHLLYGRFSTAVTLPGGLDFENLNCRLRDGVLEIQIPVAESSKPRQIKIQVGEEPKAIRN